MLKRFFDYFLTLPGIVVALPVIIMTSILVRVKLGTPVLFVQERPGLHGRIFRMYKFRTMTDEKDAAGNLLPDGDRLTSFGRLLRSTSLDELPALINVVKGDMSLVGPRPLLVEYLGRYTPEQARRHQVRPGITGWAQVNGRNILAWEEKFKLDVWYVDNQTLWLDVKILFLTVCKTLKREDINQQGQATMEKFMGTRRDA